jgi:ABC-type dipeptide/oligopeptide/nickel transport system permease subunit
MRVSTFFLLLLLAFIVVATIKFPGSFIEAQTGRIFLSASYEHWLGTDSLGRDYFWRLILALRTSFSIAFGSAIISFIIGVALGSWSAWASPNKSYTLNRFFDIVQGLPSFLLLAVIMQFYITRSALASLVALALYCGLFHWTQLARLTRSQVFKTMQEPYVDAALALGGSPLHIFKNHLWPSVYSLWLAWFCFHIPAEIMFESTLSFLGFGIQPPQTSLGLLIEEGWKYLDDKPIFLFAPAVLSFFVVMSFRKILSRFKQDKFNNAGSLF